MDVFPHEPEDKEAGKNRRNDDEKGIEYPRRGFIYQVHIYYIYGPVKFSELKFKGLCEFAPIIKGDADGDQDDSSYNDDIREREQMMGRLRSHAPTGTWRPKEERNGPFQVVFRNETKLAAVGAHRVVIP